MIGLIKLCSTSAGMEVLSSVAFPFAVSVNVVGAGNSLVAAVGIAHAVAVIVYVIVTNNLAAAYGVANLIVVSVNVVGTLNRRVAVGGVAHTVTVVINVVSAGLALLTRNERKSKSQRKHKTYNFPKLHR